MAKVSYRDVVSFENGKKYVYEKYGQAEALLLIKDEIIIGINNYGN